jgi:hypothetical protein
VDKPTVYYRTDRPHRVQIGCSAVIYPYSHESPYVTGDGETVAQTSAVTRVDENGEFWTLNTHYVPCTYKDALDLAHKRIRELEGAHRDNATLLAKIARECVL